jgi:hypothetical protein
MPSSSKTIDVLAQPIRQNRLHKFLHKKLGIPRNIVQPFLTTFKIIGSPHQYRQRKQLAKDILAEGKQRLFIPEEDGYRIFGPDDFQEIGPIVRYCAKVYQESRETFAAESLQKHPTKKFLFPILEGVEFFRHPALLQLMVSRLFLDAAITYLGAVPRLAGARLCWSPKNETNRSSQLYHFDYEDLKQVKVFINIFETKEDQGPFTFLPANISEAVQRSIGRVIGRVHDERIYEGGGRNQEVKLVGQAGSGAFVDTCRCLHYGSRLNQRDRVVLIIQFLKWHSSYQSTAPFQVPDDLPGLNLDPVQKLALGIT